MCLQTGALSGSASQALMKLMIEHFKEISFLNSKFHNNAFLLKCINLKGVQAVLVQLFSTMVSFLPYPSFYKDSLHLSFLNLGAATAVLLLIQLMTLMSG